MGLIGECAVGKVMVRELILSDSDVVRHGPLVG